MSFKVFTAFFATLLAVHASTETPLEDSSAKTEVATLLETALQITAELLHLANSVVNDLKTDEESIKDKTVNFAVKIADKVNHAIVSLVDDLKEGATADGKAVIGCIEAEELKTDAAIRKFAKDAGTCLGNEAKLVFKEMDTVLNHLGNLQANVKGVVDKLRDCTSNDADCLLTFGERALAILQQIEPVVKEDVADIVDLANTISSDVSACKLEEEIKASAQDIFNEAVVCIKK